jgi:predicted membrane-bound spermidine synthase
MNLLIYLTVFICGAAVLAVEILGTRIIGPFYGVSLFLWSALISITLVALSAGYMIGGRIADKKRSFTSLSVIIFLAGLLVIMVPLLRDYIIDLSEPLGLRTAVLTSSFILFFPPLTLLGMVSPYAIKLRTETIEEVGTRAGDLYAVSTIGSVIAALLTGFILIPSIGVIKLTIATGVLLIILSLIVFAAGRKNNIKFIAAAGILIITFAGYSSINSEDRNPPEGIIEARQSSYGELKVAEAEDIRYLLIDGGIHSAVKTADHVNVLKYVWVLDLLKNIKGYSGDMLLIGLRRRRCTEILYHEDNWDTEAVEIDPVVTDLAYRYFGLNVASQNIHHLDGREFLKSTGKLYDIIIFDAFGSSAIPFHLTTVEVFSLAKSKLKKDGILSINVESIGWNDMIVHSIGVTLKKVFGNVIVMPIAEPPDQLGNVIIAASDGKIELEREIFRDYTDPDYRFSPEYEMAHAWDNRFEPDIKSGSILTDDLNPVEIWSERINLRARKELHSYFGRESFAW